MNIFVLHKNPILAALLQCDQHAIKMSTEYMQMLCTAHRVLDGTAYYDKTAAGRRIQRWRLDDPFMEQNVYKACHVNHPCNIWLRETNSNYEWLYQLWKHTTNEYRNRYGKTHATVFLNDKLKLAQHPRNIPIGSLTEFPKAMPDEFKVDDVVESYHNFYRGSKARFATWKTEIPQFMRAA